MRFTSRHLTVGVIAASLVLALCDVLWLDTYRYAVASPDFFVYYLAAQLGSAHGWTVIYDPSIFLPAERAVVGRPLPYLNPPELAWLVLPLSWLPYAIAAWIWKAILAAAFIAAALSLGLTAGLMVLLKSPHPPAGATTLIVSLGILTRPSQLLLLMAAVVLLTLQAIAINRLAGPQLPDSGPTT